MRQIIIIFLLLILPGSVSAQILTDSNLPIVIINTDGGVSIPDDPRVLATMKIIYRGEGERNYMTDQNNTAYLNYNGRIDIEIRGSSSQITEKKQYGFSTKNADNITNNNVRLLGLPAEHDWILNGMVFDPALIRDYLCFNLSRQIGEYASRAVYCELIINGEYTGLYLLDEKIKADDNRVDVIKIDPNDVYLPGLSGGYITKADKTSAGDPAAWTMTTWTGAGVNYIHVLPKPEIVNPLQNDYIHNQFTNLAATTLAGNGSAFNGYPSIIDVPSFIDYIIINELSSNADAYQFSTYFHKDRNGKLRAGPVWDSDLTFGNDLFIWGMDRSKTNIWQLSNGINDGSRFWKDLFDNGQFRCYLSKRWNELIQPGQPLNLSSIEAFIDQTVSTISEAVVRENALWGFVGSHQQRITDLKTWLAARIDWMTTNLGSYSACSNIVVPPLVITKIMYNPEASVYYTDSDDLEFLEIMNNSDQVVSLSGIYFSGTGLVYQFPYNATLNPYSSVFLASNPDFFLAEYGFLPYGQFTRHLSDKGQNLVLSDVIGNVIDNVNYSDTVPWPDADGNGNYLLLTDPFLDNNVAGSWTTSNDKTLSDNDIITGFDLQLSPNPVRDMLKIKAPSLIKSISIYDIYGRLLKTVNVNYETYELEMKQLSEGIYIIRVITPGKIYSGKIVRY
ncbi:MAG: CotH kinase family protein [Bacteroidales bacterium]|nr:CotH kinase family protein [Bacteroidales bacterium]